MTYFGFLLRFLVIPLVFLIGVTIRDTIKRRPMPGFDSRKVPLIIAAHILLALVYTTPWDNYLVASGVWTYNPALVTGIVFGYVPLEEYTFFVLETLLAGLWWWFWARRLAPHALGTGIKLQEPFRPSNHIRMAAFGVLFATWITAAWLFFRGPEEWNYLSITLFWALPAIFPQALFGADILWHHRKLIILVILPLSAYLSLMDIFALRDTTWSISPAQTTGVLFFGILPLEEVAFFFITNILVGFGMTLVLSELGWQRFTDWKARKFKGLP
jgi:lycopene beta-cyclase